MFSNRTNAARKQNRSALFEIVLIFTTDIADRWEREGVDPKFFYLFSVSSYAVGIDIQVYTMAH
jgi:hypothetical protein